MREYQKQGRGASVLAKFQRQLSLKDMLSGPVAIMSQVIEYRDAAGAQQGIEFIVRAEEGEGGQVISSAKLGDRVVALQTFAKKGGIDAAKFTFAVQRQNYVILVEAAGLRGGTSADDAYRLAEAAARKLGGR